MRFKTLLLASAVTIGLAAPAIVAPAPAQADWIAVSVQGNGWGFGRGFSEEEARANAIFQCEQVNGSCSRGTAVEDWWYLVAVECGGAGFTAGSQHSEQQAINNAVQKARNAGYNSRCNLVGSW